MTFPKTIRNLMNHKSNKKIMVYPRHPIAAELVRTIGVSLTLKKKTGLTESENDPNITHLILLHVKTRCYTYSYHIQLEA